MRLVGGGCDLEATPNGSAWDQRQIDASYDTEVVAGTFESTEEVGVMRQVGVCYET